MPAFVGWFGPRRRVRARRRPPSTTSVPASSSSGGPVCAAVASATPSYVVEQQVYADAGPSGRIETPLDALLRVLTPVGSAEDAQLRLAARTASRRLVTCSFDSSAETWWSTVLVEMNSRWAISALVEPSREQARGSRPGGWSARRGSASVASRRRDGIVVAPLRRRSWRTLAATSSAPSRSSRSSPARVLVGRAGVDERERLVVRRRQRRPHRRGRVEAPGRAAAGTARRRPPGRRSAPGRIRGRRRAGAATSRARRAPTPGRRPWRRGEQRAALVEAVVGDAPQPRPLDQRGGRRQQPDRLAEPAGQLPRLLEIGVGVAAAAQRDQPADEVRPRARQRGARTGEHRVGVGDARRPSRPASASSGPREPSCHTRQIGRSRSMVSGRREAEQLGGLPQPPLLDVEVGEVAVPARVDLVEVLVGRAEDRQRRFAAAALALAARRRCR